jgi:hypothetical protein
VAGGELQLAQHGGDVGFDGFDGDVEVGCHLFVGVTARDEPHHFLFARRQPVEFVVARGDCGGTGGGSEGVEYEAGEPR